MYLITISFHPLHWFTYEGNNNGRKKRYYNDLNQCASGHRLCRWYFPVVTKSLNYLNANGGCLCFKTSTSKTKEMRMDSKSREPITVRDGTNEAVNDFIYLGSKMQADRDSKPDVKRRISKSIQALSMLKLYGNQINSATKPRSVSLNQRSSVFSFTGVKDHGKLP